MILKLFTVELQVSLVDGIVIGKTDVPLTLFGDNVNLTYKCKIRPKITRQAVKNG